ncbi:MAG TPA: hypothetical protein VFX65_12355 [Candidatus Limnocylindrales bacterium]|nr:hypothetical protein [Candidatus Limnocylindrales bacterium]
MEELQHVALPKLYGAPAYARPPVTPVAQTPRPVTPDDLPIAAEMTDEDLRLLESIPESGDRVPAATPAAVATAIAPRDSLDPRPFSLRAFADRFRPPRR